MKIESVTAQRTGTEFGHQQWHVHAVCADGSELEETRYLTSLASLPERPPTLAEIQDEVSRFPMLWRSTGR